MPTCPSRQPSSGRPVDDVSHLRPGAAERARSVAARPSATVCAAGLEGTRVLAHAITADGRTLLAVPSDGELMAAVAAAPERDLSALVMVSDHAPVALRRPIRAQLWLSGWVTPVGAAAEREAVLAFAEVRPEELLLDVGRTVSLLRLDLAEVVLGEAGTTVEVGPLEFLAAGPDPLAGVEAGHLRHLDRDHPEFLALLAGLLPAGTMTAQDVLRPLGIDRFGFRLRIERPAGHLDVRVPFARPLTCPGQLGPAVQQLTCAARAGRRPQ